MTDIPLWAIDKAAQAAGFNDRSSLAHLTRAHAVDRSIRAHARLIAKHEQPPVDPDLIEARRLAALRHYIPGEQLLGNNYISGLMDNEGEVQLALVGIKRGRELEKEGK